MSDNIEPSGVDTKFFSRVSASISHELSNVLTVIGELSGLIEDLVFAASRGRPLLPEKLDATAKKIGAQVLRGKSIVTDLNRFSHSVDVKTKPLDLHEAAARFSRLVARPLRQRGLALSLSSSEAGPVVQADEFALYRLLFAMTDRLAAYGAPLAMQLETTEDSIFVHFYAESADTAESGEMMLEDAALARDAAIAGGVLSPRSAQPGWSLIFLPQRLEEEK